MGLDASFRRFGADDLFYLRDEWDFHFALLEANSEVGGPDHVDAPIPVSLALLDVLDELIGDEAAARAGRDFGPLPHADPEERDAAASEHRAMLAVMRERHLEGDCIFYCYSC